MKCHINDCFKIKSKQMIKMTKKVVYVRFKSYERKITSQFMIYDFSNSMIEESKYFSDVMEKSFRKELLMAKKDHEDFKNYAKCWICDYVYVNSDVKVRDNCHIIGKYRGSAHKDVNVKVKLNHKISSVFRNLKNIICILSSILSNLILKKIS